MWIGSPNFGPPEIEGKRTAQERTVTDGGGRPRFVVLTDEGNSSKTTQIV